MFDTRFRFHVAMNFTMLDIRDWFHYYSMKSIRPFAFSTIPSTSKRQISIAEIF